MGEFVRVAKAGEVPDPGQRLVTVDDRFVVLFHVGGSFYCLDDVCTHDDGPLGEGHLCGHTVACPRHGAKFDIRTGAALTMPATEAIRAHEVRVADGIVYVRIRED
jgi:3-phenylpropionate/trans-cinnamate dioxygenase ferredoxin component